MDCAGGALWPKTIRSDAVLELESHIRDQVQKRIDAGVPAAQAFTEAMARVGTPQDLAGEFGKTSLLGARSQTLVKLRMPSLEKVPTKVKYRRKTLGFSGFSNSPLEACLSCGDVPFLTVSGLLMSCHDHSRA